MGVGDVGAVLDGARGRGHAAGGDDGGGAVREHEPDDVGGRGGREHSAWVEPGRDGVGVGDGARGKPGAGGVHVDGAIRGDGVRGDGVGVRDVLIMFAWSWCVKLSLRCSHLLFSRWVFNKFVLV